MYRVSDELSPPRLDYGSRISLLSKEGGTRTREREGGGRGQRREMVKEEERRLAAFAAASDVTLGCLAGN